MTPQHCARPVEAPCGASSAPVPPHLIAAARKRYAVGEGFARAYLEYWFRARARVYDGLEEILEAPDPYPTWFEYGMSGILRGDGVLALLRHRLDDLPGRRYLDVGCGLGGSLIAFSRAGFEVTGIEVDVERLRLAEANCRDLGLIERVHLASIMDRERIASLGRFDVITMIDVIEHVDDAERAVRHVLELLAPGGVLLMQIPNQDALDAVARDGHFNLFGITQLARGDAERLHQLLFEFPYDVGDYHPLRRYRAWLEEGGCRVERIREAAAHPRLREIPRGLRLLLASWWTQRARWRPVPWSMRLRVGGHVLSFLGVFAFQLGGLAVGVQTADQITERYLTAVWTLVARKAARAHPSPQCAT